MNNIKRKIIYNLIGTALPMVAGLLAIPALIKLLGVERFGILSIAWMLVGYFGLLDMGLGRSLTQKVSERIGSGDTKNLKPLIWKSTIVAGFLGLLGTLLVALLSEKITNEVLKVSSEYMTETQIGFYWIAVTIPVVIVSSCLFGVLEGKQKFEITALIRGPLGIFIFIAPIIALQHTNNLTWSLGSLFFTRLFFLIILTTITIQQTKKFIGWKTEKEELMSLFKFGGWVTISNIISPVMVYFDRFYIAATLTATVVAYYTTPFDLLTKSLIIPFAIVGVMFTSFASKWQTDKESVLFQFKKTTKLITTLMLPICMVIVIFAKPALTLWLDKDFAIESYIVTQVLAVGIFINALAMVPFAFIQAIGRADITAKIHIIELPFYILSLWFFVNKFGLIGAALAWAIRVLIDAILLFSVSLKIIR